MLFRKVSPSGVTDVPDAKKKKHHRKLVALLLFGAVLALAGGAYAYFTSGGGGTGNASVGSSTALAVATQGETGDMFPGYLQSVVPFTITNPAHFKQTFAAVSPAVAQADSGPNAGDILTGTLEGGAPDPTTAVPGCLASWFTPTLTNPIADPITLDATGGTNDSYSGNSITVTMTESGSNQDPCQGSTPLITVVANGSGS